MSSIISQAELARLCGVTRMVVNKAIRAGHIKTRKTGKIKKVVFDDQLTQLWFEKQTAKASINAPQQQSEQKPAITTGKNNLATLQQQKTLEEIRKITADANLKELKYAKERGELIDKNSIAKVLFQYLEAFNINAIEIPEMIIDSVMDRVKAGASRGDIIKIMRDKIMKEIKNTKKSIKERLK